jgi:hypothetical protein
MSGEIGPTLDHDSCRVRDSGNRPKSIETWKTLSLCKMLHTRNKMKTKQRTSVGQMMEAMATNERCLILGAMVGGIGLSQVL